VLGPGTMWGREVLARAGAALDAGLTGDAVGLAARDGRLVAAKPAFGGLCEADIHSSSPIQMATVRAGVLPPLQPRAAAPISIDSRPAWPQSRVRILTRTRDDDRDDDREELASAEVVLGVGHGVTPDEYSLLWNLAQQMGGTLAATRKVTDNGWLPRARQIGITGHSLSRKLGPGSACKRFLADVAREPLLSECSPC
jgi:electron transfer flavoprotein alpha subunit